jgi:hypothetical protein
LFFPKFSFEISRRRFFIKQGKTRTINDSSPQ